jgi:excisionase family DNA binding protein
VSALASFDADHPSGGNRSAGVARLLLKPEEAAEVLGIGRSTLYELLAAGQIESVHIGKARRIPVASLEQYVERLRAEQNPSDRKEF